MSNSTLQRLEPIQRRRIRGIPQRLHPSISCTLFFVLVALAVSREAEGAGTARIGLFLPASDLAGVEAGELEKGAALAVEACGAGCALMRAPNAGQWSAGAGELVRLVYAAEGSSAVLGPVDSRSAHLAEQVVARAKGQFLLLTPWASDPTLTQVRVPWFFRLVPDDARQAEALVTEIYGARGLHTLVLVIAPSHYDSRAGAAAFEKVAHARALPAPQEIAMPEGADSLDRLVAAVRHAAPEAVIVFTPPDTAARAVRGLREAGITAPFFGPLRLASPTFLDRASETADGMILAAPAESVGPTAERFQARYGKTLSTPAAYGYDGAAVLIDALQATTAGGGDVLRAALAATQRSGVTGRIEFDASGNRAGAAPLAQVERGHLRSIRGNDHRPAAVTTAPIASDERISP
jgi:ABC-type branched-subunit amino acid transport system substrate-binding protein